MIRRECLYPENVKLSDRIFAIGGDSQSGVADGWLLVRVTFGADGQEDNAVLLFSHEERANHFLNSGPNPAYQKIAFPSVVNLIDRLRRQSAIWILLNESPELQNGLLIRKDRFISDLERRMGAGDQSAT